MPCPPPPRSQSVKSTKRIINLLLKVIGTSEILNQASVRIAEDGTVLRSMERYDPSENKWFSLAPMHEQRYDFGCVAISNFIYVVGGIGGDQNHWLRSVER